MIETCCLLFAVKTCLFLVYDRNMLFVVCNQNTANESHTNGFSIDLWWLRRNENGAFNQMLIKHPKIVIKNSANFRHKNHTNYNVKNLEIISQHFHHLKSETNHPVESTSARRRTILFCQMKWKANGFSISIPSKYIILFSMHDANAIENAEKKKRRNFHFFLV